MDLQTPTEHACYHGLHHVVMNHVQTHRLYWQDVYAASVYALVHVCWHAHRAGMSVSSLASCTTDMLKEDLYTRQSQRPLRVPMADGRVSPRAVPQEARSHALGMALVQLLADSHAADRLTSGGVVHVLCAVLIDVLNAQAPQYTRSLAALAQIIDEAIIPAIPRYIALMQQPAAQAYPCAPGGSERRPMAATAERSHLQEAP